MNAGVAPTTARRRWRRLIPAILVIYIIAYIDRVNLGFGMTHIRDDLGMTAAEGGLAAGVFFIGYLVLQVPGGYLAQRWSVKRLVTFLMIAWGLCAIGSGFVQSYGQLLVVRFLLGVFEGGVQPALMVLIRRWFPAAERGRAFSLFIMHNPIATIITAPFAGLVLSFGSWRDLLIIQGALPLVIGVALWWWIAADRPEDARWLSAAELAEIKNLKAQDRDETVEADWRVAVRSKYVWILAATGMLVWLGFYGLQLWLPTLLKTLFTGELVVGVVAALPPVAAAAAIWFNGRGADRDGRYSVRVAVPLVLGGTILACSTLITADMRWMVVLALCVATACQLSFFGPYWAISSAVIEPRAVGTGFGIINGVGNLGGLLGPYIGGWLQGTSLGLPGSTVFFGCSVIAAGLIAFSLRGAIARARSTSVASAVEPDRAGSGRTR